MKYATDAENSAPIFISHTPGIKVSQSRFLPGNPVSPEGADYCSHYLLDNPGRHAKFIGKAGWLVTNEYQDGNLELVSFTSSFELGTSGICFAKDGNIALFNDGNLAAIAYSVKGADLVLGSISLISGKSGEYYINDGNGPYAPLAKLTVNDGIAEIMPLPEQESYCSDEAIVPNIYGKKITDGRNALLKAGWKPLGDKDGGAEHLLRLGISEVESCSGTGYGFCRYSYGKGDMTLWMTSVGEEYNIVSQSVNCGAGE
ncbi:MAG: hypothetical protein HC843_12530 [Sphingomonadales bacterium]|nr:hypothetical protein [Sphingomonadales bacterium]